MSRALVFCGRCGANAPDGAPASWRCPCRDHDALELGEAVRLDLQHAPLRRHGVRRNARWN